MFCSLRSHQYSTPLTIPNSPLEAKLCNIPCTRFQVAKLKMNDGSEASNATLADIVIEAVYNTYHTCWYTQEIR